MFFIILLRKENRLNATSRSRPFHQIITNFSIHFYSLFIYILFKCHIKVTTNLGGYNNIKIYTFVLFTI